MTSILLSRKILTAFLLLLTSSGVMAVYPCETDRLEVLFNPDCCVRLTDNQPIPRQKSFSPDTTKTLNQLSPVKWERLVPLVDERTLDQYHHQAELNSNKSIYNLNNAFTLILSNNEDVWKVAEQLKILPDIINAYPVPLPMPLPTPNWQSEQEYLNNTANWPPTGFNAYHAWTFPGGNGSGVTICDLEYSWNTNHVDLTKALNAQKNPHAQDPFSDTDHGTAVLGELIADNNGWGVTGISHGADLIVYGTYYDPTPPHTNPQWRLSGAITEAMSYLKAGDVILLEQQWAYDNFGTNYIPVEWFGNYSPSSQTLNTVYAAIQTAVGNGIHVVEAAGNGGVDLDTLSWYGDSGAIIVGAGGAYSGGAYPAGDLTPLGFSSYGSRVNVHGWGENVATTGYGTFTGYTSVNDMFCWDFAGTSSASPMVAASVACCVGYWTQHHFQPATSLTPDDMRTILINTGTPQDTFTTKHIGPRPDLKEAFIALDNRAPAYFYEVDLQMPSSFYNNGDPFYLNAMINNPGAYGGIKPLVILLEIQGQYWFYPTWSPSFSYVNYELFPGAYAMQILPSFNWPSGTGTLNGIKFYGALLTSDFQSILGLYDVETFGFSS